MKITKLFKVLLIVLSLVMVISAVSCGEAPAETTTATKAEATEAPAETTAEPDKTDAPKETDAPEATDAPKETDAPTTPEETDAPETTVAPAVTEATEADGTEKSETDGTTESSEPEEAECKHTKGAYTYGTDNDATTKNAVLVAKCTKCGEVLKTKDATFYCAIEAIYGNDTANSGNVVLFQADGAHPPIMGSEQVTLGAGEDNCPADGVHPIDYNSSTSFKGMFGVSGWVGYVGSSVSDGAAFMAVDQNGNVVLDWTPITGILDSSGLPLVKDGEDGIDTTLANSYTDATVSGIRFNHIVDARQYSELAGKTVDIIFAFTTAKGVDGDVYIPYLTFEDVQIPAAQ